MHCIEIKFLSFLQRTLLINNRYSIEYNYFLIQYPIKMKTVRIGFLTAVVTAACFIQTVWATNYFVDPSSPSTTANGQLGTPWKTLAQVSSASYNLKPGDSVFFKRGQIYTGRLTIGCSGTITAPIVFTHYGSGALPEFNNAFSDIINIYNRQYIVIDGMKIIDRSISETDRTVQAKVSYAINIDNSPYCSIKNCDISRVGVAISVTNGSNFTEITGNTIYNLRMVRNTPTSVNPDDDYGANPMVIGSSNNTITKNKFSECWALSYDYGFDGGAVEFFGNAMNNNTIMYNEAVNCNGFLEIGSNSNGKSDNTVIAYNKIINCGIIGVYQNGSTFSVTVTNLKYHNNTIIETIKQYTKPNALFWMAGTGTTGMLTLTNNVFWLSSGVNVASAKFNSGQMLHSNNVFRMSAGVPGITLNNTELLSSSASIFQSVEGNPITWNSSPAAGSPTIDFGINLGYTVDYNGQPIIGKPDAGALESTGIESKIVQSPLIASGKADSILCFDGISQVAIAGTGGTPPYIGTGNFSVKAGYHAFIVKDALGNADTVVMTISEPKAIAASLASGTITTSGGSTTIAVNATGGISPYTYSLNNTSYQSSATFTSIYPGTYTVSIKDSNGCIITKSISVTESLSSSVWVRYKVSISPNPSNAYFKLSVSHVSSKNLPVYIRVLDINGKTVHSSSGSIYSVFYFGHSFYPGTYYVRVTIGSNSKTYTVLKI